MSDNQLILLLKKGDKKAIKHLYVNHRDEFIAFAKRYSISQDDILDCYQDAIISLGEQAVNGKLDNLKSSVKTYFFGIGKYMIYEKFRKNNKTILQTSTNEIETVEVDYDTEIITLKQRLLKKGFSSLGKKCQEVLTLFYYRGYTLDEITEHLNYENKDVTKSQKSRCLKQLKKIINE